MNKKIIIIALTMFATIACATKEEKAQKLFDELMHETLTDNNYELVKLTVDTLFETPFEYPEIIRTGMEAARLTKRQDSLITSAGKNISEARFLLHRDHARSNEYSLKAKWDIDEVIKTEKKLSDITDGIIMAASLCSGKHVGWKITCLYRCEENASLQSMNILTNLNITEITDYYENGDFNRLGGTAFVRHAISKADKSFR